MARAAGTPPAADQMVICTGMGPRVIYVDAEGNPTSAPHICPDCALGVMQGLLGQGIVLAGIMTWQKVRADAEECRTHCPEYEAPKARDPPWQI